MPMKWTEVGGENPLTLNKALYDAALGEFAAHSYKDASLNNILRNAGMNKGSLYHRFHDKMEVYLSLLQCVAREKLAFFEGNKISADGFFAWLHQTAFFGLMFAKKYPMYHALWQRLLVEEPSVKDTIAESFGAVSDNMIGDMIEAGKQSGELRRDIPTDLLVGITTILFYRADSLVLPEHSDAEIMKRIDMMIDVMKCGIKGDCQAQKATTPH